MEATTWSTRNESPARDFTLLYLWIKFWANGGSACRADVEAFVHCLQTLSDHDVLVLGPVVEELHDV